MPLLLLLLFLTGCHSPRSEKAPPFTIQEFVGRDLRPVYKAKVPEKWVRHDSKGSLLDTTLPIVTFQVAEGIKVTVHTFPSNRLEERISPFAQIERWKKQSGAHAVKPVSWGGFAGLSLEGSTILAWSMQLDIEHYQTLNFLISNKQEETYFKQLQADYTIKATGSKELIAEYRNEIQFFAHSFELIQEIPKRI